MADKTFSEIVTFTRSTPAWGYDSTLELVEFAVDEPRLVYDPSTGESLGLLIEEARTRLNTIAAAPADPENVTVTATAHTISFFGTGTVELSGVATETLVGTGADDRVTLTFTPTAGTLTIAPSGTVTDLQLEEGSFATSVIRGEGSQVTREADNCSRTLGAEFNADSSAVTFAFEIVESRDDPVSIIGLNDSTGNTSPRQDFRVFTSGAVSIGGISTGLSIVEGSENKGALFFDEDGNFGAALNGTVVTDVRDEMSTAYNYLLIGRVFDGLFEMTGTLSDVRLHPRALTAEELAILTAPEAS